jgi:NAD(P)-dependent dehydrogenase (short-subunit alcohol dehydrogenase family)
MRRRSGALAGQVCLVTGAGKGIGRAVAERFAAEGAKLALISRTESDVLDLRRRLGLSRGRLVAEVGDVSSDAVVDRWVDAAREAFGRIDVLVNNAGIRLRKPLLDTTLEEWSQVLTANLTSAYLCCRAAGRHMVAARGGRIINMASIIGTRGLADVAAYGASKGGLITLTKCLAVEWAPLGVRVNAIAPGFCETSYAERFRTQRPELHRWTLQRTPQRRWGTAREVAEACLFLASDASSYVTGQVLSVDGGWSAG